MGIRKTYLNCEHIEQDFKKEGIDEASVAIDELEQEITLLVKKKIKSLKVKKHEAYETASPFLLEYPDYDADKLPSWIKKELDNARIVGKTKQTVILADGRKYQLNNSLNHLSGGEWTYFTNSVLNTSYNTYGSDGFAHRIRKIHPTPKPPQLMRDIIKFFTKENEMVFDYFAGVGGSLLGAGLCSRKAVGVELNVKYIEAYKSAAEEIGVPVFNVICGDCLQVMSNKALMQQTLGNETISLVLIDPPYGNMMSREKTGAEKKDNGGKATPFTNSKDDFGNFDLTDFIIALKKSVEEVIQYVKFHGHIVVFIKDLQPEGKETNLLHAQIIESLNSIDGLQYKGLKIWADQTVKLFPYGYPFTFVANQIHQYILVFRKEEGQVKKRTAK